MSLTYANIGETTTTVKIIPPSTFKDSLCFSEVHFFLPLPPYFSYNQWPNICL